MCYIRNPTSCCQCRLLSGGGQGDQVAERSERSRGTIKRPSYAFEYKTLLIYQWLLKIPHPKIDKILPGTLSFILGALLHENWIFSLIILKLTKSYFIGDLAFGRNKNNERRGRKNLLRLTKNRSQYCYSQKMVKRSASYGPVQWLPFLDKTFIEQKDCIEPNFCCACFLCLSGKWNNVHAPV